MLKGVRPALLLLLRVSSCGKRNSVWSSASETPLPTNHGSSHSLVQKVGCWVRACGGFKKSFVSLSGNAHGEGYMVGVQISAFLVCQFQFTWDPTHDSKFKGKQKWPNWRIFRHPSLCLSQHSGGSLGRRAGGTAWLSSDGYVWERRELNDTI